MCDLTAGRLEPCKDSVGGAKAVYFINYGAEATLDADEKVTDLGVVTAYKYDVKGLTGLEETVNSSRDTGTTFWEQVLSMTLKKLDYTTRKEIKLMAYGRPHIVIHDKNGNAFLVGKDNGMDVTGGTIVTGQAMGDLSGYTLALTGQEKNPANFLDGATEADPFAGFTTPPTIVEGT